MDFGFTPEQEGLRQEIRQFLAEELTPERRAAYGAHEFSALYGVFSKEFSRKLAQRGWIGLHWPKEYGGQGLTLIERLIYEEEMTLAYAPVGYHFFAERQMAPSILQFGTEEQKRFFLPRIARGECGFCIGYSEPGIGSDLASLQTSARLDGDEYVVNGTKMWTSNAHLQDYIWLAVRTNPNVPRHKGISVLIVDLKSPGITIQPIINMVGLHDFNQVFFDNVRVPVTNRVGEHDGGWEAILHNLDYERASIDRIYRFYPLFQELVRYAQEKRERTGGQRLWEADESAREKLAEIATQFEVGRLLCYRAAWLLSQGKPATSETAIYKLFASEVSQRFAQLATEILGARVLIEGDDSPEGRLAANIARAYLWSFSLTIAAGTSEVMRNIIAHRGLGLPRA